MVEIVLKLFIIIIFLAMNEIPYIVKVLGIGVLGTVLIIDWYTTDDNN